MIKKILYWIIVVVIVVGAVYSYQKVGFGRKLAMLYQLATGNSAMGGPGGAPPGGEQMGMGPGGERGQMQPGEMGSQPPQMEQSLQGRQMPGMTTEGGQGQFQTGDGRGQGPPQMGQDMQGGGPNSQEGGRQGGPPPGNGPGGSSWYKVSVRNVLPYTFILAFFTLITCVIDNCIKRFSRSKSASVKTGL